MLCTKRHRHTMNLKLLINSASFKNLPWQMFFIEGEMTKLCLLSLRNTSKRESITEHLCQAI